MKTFDITNFGASRERKDNTDAIAAAIHACHEAGGGTVYIPSGTFKTGPIRLQSNVTLYLDNGAVLSFTDDFNRYPIVRTRWSGYVCHAFMPLIFGDNVSNVSIKGDGTIDGNGQKWWDVNRKLRRKESYQSSKTDEIKKWNADFKEPGDTNLVEWPSQFLRPPLLQFFESEHITISGITLRNSPFWNTHLVFSKNIAIDHVTFENPDDTPNGDGLDVESCENVRISNCHFSVGDDCIALKSGINEDGRLYGRPTKNVAITNCIMHAGHGGVVFGSENSGGIENVTVSNCVFDGTDRGIRIKTNRERGAYIRNITVTNIMMDGVLCPIAINSFYRHGVSRSNQHLLDGEAIEVSEKTPIVEKIRINNIVAVNTRAAAAFIYGLPEMPIRDLTLTHLTLEMTEDTSIPGGEPDMVREEIEMSGEGMYLKYIENCYLQDVRVKQRKGPALFIEEATTISLNEFSTTSQHDNVVVETDNVKDLSIEGRQWKQNKASYLKQREAVKE
ncbi:polygalacturonase [Gracilibacillus halotolerans]|uniref:Polygalacturonase n=1 Tax=Gracilibacillus halotolerans TaxID=74386 RepID=A0A841RLM9_9BACI|nr:glycoside hydrolase family 28 protein [Gracilibacillus halotolerans]MBB6512523.1 polygalacturonase [Gracilibacillus halotolerans]